MIQMHYNFQMYEFSFQFRGHCSLNAGPKLCALANTECAIENGQIRSTFSTNYFHYF